MLREVRNVRQIAGERGRRWYNAVDMDLVVWLEEGEVVGFQLAYDKQRAEKAVTWRRDADGLSHTGVDSGEPHAGKFKRSPILVAGGALDGWHVCGRFLRQSAAIPAELRDLVCRVLTGTGGNAGG